MTMQGRISCFWCGISTIDEGVVEPHGICGWFRPNNGENSLWAAIDGGSIEVEQRYICPECAAHIWNCLAKGD